MRRFVTVSCVAAMALSAGCNDRQADAGPGRSPTPPNSTPTAALLAQLCSPDQSVRNHASTQLVDIGPSVLFELCPFIRAHLADPTEHAWRAAYAVEQAIAGRYQDDPHLDDYYRSLPPVKLPTRTITLPGGVEMELVRIPAGTFIQGVLDPGTGVPTCRPNLGCRYSPIRKVTISRPFWIGRDKVTQAQWEVVMGEQANHSRTQWPSYPVGATQWPEAMEFCRRLSQLREPEVFTLPTEAMWEYAARAGTTSRHAFGNTRLYRGELSTPTGEAPENLWGLRRVHNGVFEWCFDWFGEYGESPAVDPLGPPAGLYKAIRSGYECTSAAEVCVAQRVGIEPERRHTGIGLRVVCVAP